MKSNLTGSQLVAVGAALLMLASPLAASAAVGANGPALHSPGHPHQPTRDSMTLLTIGSDVIQIRGLIGNSGDDEFALSVVRGEDELVAEFEHMPEHMLEEDLQDEYGMDWQSLNEVLNAYEEAQQAIQEAFEGSAVHAGEWLVLIAYGNEEQQQLGLQILDNLGGTPLAIVNTWKAIFATSKKNEKKEEEVDVTSGGEGDDDDDDDDQDGIDGLIWYPDWDDENPYGSQTAFDADSLDALLFGAEVGDIITFATDSQMSSQTIFLRLPPRL